MDFSTVTICLISFILRICKYSPLECSDKMFLVAVVKYIQQEIGVNK